ncbi:MAG: hypothetical protein K9J37_18990 [Saprospiraceae bacterium]|nr:hypothetical protein [Saprospiraceae bacterium]MCF8252010.1 hypothetical protein [Saprospiraceae bacterium]MCF8281699.1 hypothetical protein [Bacteroidales bacterium]MCF8313687.1 hypothetical protein [Saprospiraceae bacterium]MCF8442394.1 hypothetical protein [Saprospiraceae bacterium]
MPESPRRLRLTGERSFFLKTVYFLCATLFSFSLSAQSWGAPKKDRCIQPGRATYSARLANDAGKGWENAANTTSIVINGVNQGTPDRTSNQGLGGMWGEWDINDNSCMPKWGAAKKDRCIGSGRATYSARLASDAGIGWDLAAKRTPITINGVNQGPPKRTNNQGVGGMWGEWDINDNSCLPTWGAPKKDNCISPGIVRYSARLSTDAGMGWEAAAKSTPITINGVNQGPPKRTNNQGAGGMWGEWDIKDDACVPKWQTAKNDGCKGMGIVQYSARLSTDAGMGWEAAAKSTPITINGVSQGPPKRTKNLGVGGMWGEWDINDNSCLPTWGAPKKDNCISPGIVQYSARLSTDAGMGWEAAAKSTFIVINGVNQGPPKRTNNQGVGGMWGEWDIEDASCNPRWETPQKDFCIEDGVRQYSATFFAVEGDKEAIAKKTPINLLSKDYYPTIEWNSNQMWGVFKVSDSTCKVNWTYVDDFLEINGPSIALCKASEMNKVWSTDGCSAPLYDTVSKSYKDKFFQPCVIHDLCYALPWNKEEKEKKGKIYCDGLFLVEMQRTCNGDPICLAAAVAWADAVILFGGSSFENAQKKLRCPER